MRMAPLGMLSALLCVVAAAPGRAQSDFELPKVQRPVAPADPAQQPPAPAPTGTGFEQVLSGKVLRESYALRELGPEWKRITLKTRDSAGDARDDLTARALQAAMTARTGAAADPSTAALGAALLGGVYAALDSNQPCYTKGETVTVSGEAFLVVYMPDRPAAALTEMARQATAAGKQPDIMQIAAASEMTPDSRVALTLVNTKSIASIGRIRAFSLTAEIADSARAGAALIDWCTAWDAMHTPAPQQIPAPPTPARAANTSVKPVRKPRAH